MKLILFLTQVKILLLKNNCTSKYTAIESNKALVLFVYRG